VLSCPSQCQSYMRMNAFMLNEPSQGWVTDSTCSVFCRPGQHGTSCLRGKITDHALRGVPGAGGLQKARMGLAHRGRHSAWRASRGKKRAEV
jgi:hypothetical protein